MEIKSFLKRLLFPGFIAIFMAACSPVTANVEETNNVVPTTDSPETQAVIVPTETALPTSTRTPKDSDHIRLIWDDDGSPDGIIALLYFLSHPKVDVLAATVSYGEAHPELFIEYVADMLYYLNYTDIPIAAGKDSPLEGNNAFPDFLRNPTDNFWGIPLPTADSHTSSLSAPELIIDTISSSPEPVTVFVSGSFTNLAEAIRHDPTIVNNIQAVESMGGAINDPGNVGGVWDFGIDNKFAEWNIFVDPLSAYEVFASGIEIHLTPLDATNQVYTTREDQAELYALGNPTSKLVADLLDWKFAFQNSDRFTIFDLLAAVNTTDPQVCEWTDLYLNVVTKPGPELGRTFIDSSATSTTKVCLTPDEDAVRSIVTRVFAGEN